MITSHDLLLPTHYDPTRPLASQLIRAPSGGTFSPFCFPGGVEVSVQGHSLAYSNPRAVVEAPRYKNLEVALYVDGECVTPQELGGPFEFVPWATFWGLHGTVAPNVPVVHVTKILTDLWNMFEGPTRDHHTCHGSW